MQDISNNRLEGIICDLDTWCECHGFAVESVYNTCHGTSMQEQIYYLFGVVKEVVENGINLNTNYTALSKQFKELKTFVDEYFKNLDIQGEINKKIDELVNSGKLDEMINLLYNTIPSLSGDYSQFTKVCELEIPLGHTVQGTEYLNGFLYVLHHLSDTDEMFLSQYNIPNTTAIKTVGLGVNIHGNGLATVGDELVMSDSYTNALYFINLTSLTVRKKVNFTGVKVSSCAFSPNEKLCAINPVGGIVAPIIYEKNSAFNKYLQCFKTKPLSKGSSAVQEMSSSDMFIYTLCSTTDFINKYANNFIRVMGWNGNHFKDIMLPKSAGELEGITRVHLETGNGFYLVSITGVVYFLSTDDKIINSAPFGTEITGMNLDYSHPFTYENVTVDGYTITKTISFPEYPYAVGDSSGSLLGRFNDVFVFSSMGKIVTGVLTGGGNLRIQHYDIASGIGLMYYYNINAEKNAFVFNQGDVVYRKADIFKEVSTKNITDFVNAIKSATTAVGRGFSSKNAVIIRGIGNVGLPAIPSFDIA